MGLISNFFTFKAVEARHYEPKRIISKQPSQGAQVANHVDSYVVVDTETTGLYGETNKIIELSAVKVVNDEIVDTFDTLVRFKGRLKPEIAELTGIKPHELMTAPNKSDVFKEFAEFVEGLPLVGHNIVDFDSKFLWFGFLSVGMEPLSNKCIDTLDICRESFLADSYKLTEICKLMGIPVVNAHRAMADVKMTYEVFRRLNRSKDVAINLYDVEHEATPHFTHKVDRKYVKPDSTARICDSFEGKKFCITTFIPFDRFDKELDLQQFIVDNGGILAGVTKSTDYLIDCNPDYVSSKELKAKQYAEQGKSNIQIIGPQEFLDLVGNSIYRKQVAKPQIYGNI